MWAMLRHCDVDLMRCCDVVRFRVIPFFRARLGRTVVVASRRCVSGGRGDLIEGVGVGARLASGAHSRQQRTLAAPQKAAPRAHASAQADSYVVLDTCGRPPLVLNLPYVAASGGDALLGGEYRPRAVGIWAQLSRCFARLPAHVAEWQSGRVAGQRSGVGWHVRRLLMSFTEAAHFVYTLLVAHLFMRLPHRKCAPTG